MPILIRLFVPAVAAAVVVFAPVAVAQQGEPGETQTECEERLVGDSQVEFCPSQTGTATNTQFFNFVSNLGARVAQQRYVVRDSEEESGRVSDGLALGGAASADSGEGGITEYGRLSAFGSVDYTESDREDTGKGDAYDQHNEAVILGLDYRFSNTLFAGATFNYLAGDTDFTGTDGPVGSTDVDSYVFGLHGSKYWGNVYLDALVTYGEFDLDIERIENLEFGPDQRYGASPDGKLKSFDVALGYVHSKNRWRFTPAAKLLYMDGSIDGYTENLRSGSGTPKTYEKQDLDALNLELSLQTDYVVLMDWGVLIPSVKLAYHHEFSDPDKVSGQSNPFGSPQPFTDQPEAPDADTAVVRLGVSAQFQRGWSGFVSYEKLLGHSYLDRDNAVLGVRYEFF